MDFRTMIMRLMLTTWSNDDCVDGDCADHTK